MTDSFSKKANAFLQTESRELHSVFAKIKALEELNRTVLPYLDPHLASYCQVANLVENRLILITANGSVATQLRFQTPDLLKKFKQDPLLKKIQAIHCKVRPPLPSSPSPRLENKNQKMPLLSAETAEIIREIAESLEDPKLRKALERIAQHTDD